MHLVPYQYELPLADMQDLVLDSVRKFQWHIQHGDSLKTEVLIVVPMIISARYSSEHLILYNTSNIYSRSQSFQT